MMTRELPFDALSTILVAVKGSIISRPSRSSHTIRTSSHRHHFVLVFQTIPASSFWIMTNGLVFFIVFGDTRAHLNRDDTVHCC